MTNTDCYFGGGWSREEGSKRIRRRRLCDRTIPSLSFCYYPSEYGNWWQPPDEIIVIPSKEKKGEKSQKSSKGDQGGTASEMVMLLSQSFYSYKSLFEMSSSVNFWDTNNNKNGCKCFFYSRKPPRKCLSRTSGACSRRSRLCTGSCRGWGWPAGWTSLKWEAETPCLIR